MGAWLKLGVVAAAFAVGYFLISLILLAASAAVGYLHLDPGASTPYSAMAGEVLTFMSVGMLYAVVRIEGMNLGTQAEIGKIKLAIEAVG